ncbi:hypothetical protein PYCCODRAFT_929070 [Trametes coccinea BRFM310]|uniref:Uncharacterized protein n=1 Tax=Trametes coccinea (strain BRFM310) TaxID=1353009 RepID=A0A1Y2IZ39_TRAC3|nr:hypothetical protein PYCCODRAFT_929070 [Trametes coccinea BRFM310]
MILPASFYVEEQHPEAAERKCFSVHLLVITMFAALITIHHFCFMCAQEDNQPRTPSLGNPGQRISAVREPIARRSIRAFRHKRRPVPLGTRRVTSKSVGSRQALPSEKHLRRDACSCYTATVRRHGGGALVDHAGLLEHAGSRSGPLRSCVQNIHCRAAVEISVR